MTDLVQLAAATVATPAVLCGLLAVLPWRWAPAVALTGAPITAALAVTLAARTLTDPADPVINGWLSLDAAAAILVAVSGSVGLVSVLVSPAYLAATPDASTHRRQAGMYYAVLYGFWALLLAVPLAGNLGVAWLLLEATTAASALLIGFSRKARALEASWKYLILTSLGLGVALLGIAMLATGIPGGGLGILSWRALSGYTAGTGTALVAYVLLLAGLAAKIGWAPVHNWLPDAHSEAPAPVSALLSAALLPTVLLVAWRCEQGLAPVIGATTTRGIIIGFGLLSIAVAVPFLARPLVWKRMLAYSSLEHMGVLALGIGFASPLALVGVAVHVVAHAAAKTLGFSTSTPLLNALPGAATAPVSGVGRRQPALGAFTAITIATLAGVPPSPIFVSELLILAGGVQAHQIGLSVVAAILLALAFIALLRSALDITLGEPATDTAADTAPARRRPIGLAGTATLTAVCVVVLLALAVAAIWLPTTQLAAALAQGVR